VKNEPVEQNLYAGKEFSELIGAPPKQLILVRAPITKLLPSLVLLFRDDGLPDQIAKDVAGTCLPQIRNSAECPQLEFLGTAPVPYPTKQTLDLTLGRSANTNVHVAERQRFDRDRHRQRIGVNVPSRASFPNSRKLAGDGVHTTAAGDPMREKSLKQAPVVAAGDAVCARDRYPLLNQGRLPPSRSEITAHCGDGRFDRMGSTNADDLTAHCVPNDEFKRFQEAPFDSRREAVPFRMNLHRHAVGTLDD
jgi:hypothetical protein